MTGHAVQVLIGVSVVLSLAANVTIWRDTWRWKDTGTRPVAASWAEWAALTGTGAAAAWRAGQMPAAIYAACCAAGCAVVVPLALRIPRDERDEPERIGQARLDVVLLPAAMAGLMLLVTPMTTVGHGWIRTSGPAVAVAVVTDLLAYLPTAAHAWRHPAAEPWRVYGLFGVAAAASLAAVALQGQMLDLTAAAYPLYLTAANLGVAAMIVARRPGQARAAQLPAEPYPDETGWALRAILDATWPAGLGRAWTLPSAPPREEPAWTEPARQAAVGQVVGLLAREVHH